MSSTDRFKFEQLEDRTFGMRVSSGAAEPPAEWPKFTLLELMLATTAVAAQIGFFKLIGAYVLYGTIVLWVVLLVRQLDYAREAAVQLATWIVGGLFIPLTLVAILRNAPQSSMFDLNGCALTILIFTGGFSVWIFVRHIRVPIVSACLCGWMALSGISLLIFGCVAAAAGVQVDTNKVPYAFLSAIPSLLMAVGTMTAGAVAAATQFSAARQAWRRSHRDSRAFLFALIGAPLLMSILGSVLALFIPAQTYQKPPTPPASMSTPSAPAPPTTNSNTSTTSATKTIEPSSGNPDGRSD